MTKVPLAVPPSCVQTAILAPPSAHLVITKTGPRQVRPSGTIVYPLTVTNLGPDPAENVVIKDPANRLWCGSCRCRAAAP